MAKLDLTGGWRFEAAQHAAEGGFAGSVGSNEGNAVAAVDLKADVFEVEDRRLHIYPGNYEDYLWRKQGGPEKVTAAVTNSNVSAASGMIQPGTNPGAPRPASGTWVSEAPAKPQAKRLNPIKLKQMQARLAFAETEIPNLESAIAAAEQSQAVFTTAEEAQRIAAELARLRTQHTTLTAEWEELSLALEDQAAV